jgi:hypothetical protein
MSKEKEKDKEGQTQEAQNDDIFKDDEFEEVTKGA